MTENSEDEASTSGISAEELQKYIRDNGVTCHLVTAFPGGFIVYLEANLGQSEQAVNAIRRKMGGRTILRSTPGTLTVLNGRYGANIKP